MKALAGGLLIDGTGQEPVPNAGVLVDDEGRITRAGKLGSLPAEAEVIDVSGRTIMPGLIDSHVHFFIELKPMHNLALTPPSLRVMEAAQNARATLDAGIHLREGYGNRHSPRVQDGGGKRALSLPQDAHLGHAPVANGWAHGFFVTQRRPSPHAALDKPGRVAERDL